MPDAVLASTALLVFAASVDLLHCEILRTTFVGRREIVDVDLISEYIQLFHLAPPSQNSGIFASTIAFESGGHTAFPQRAT